jgi:hypothetical protein
LNELILSTASKEKNGGTSKDLEGVGSASFQHPGIHLYEMKETKHSLSLTMRFKPDTFLSQVYIVTVVAVFSAK